MACKEGWECENSCRGGEGSLQGPGRAGGTQHRGGAGRECGHRTGGVGMVGVSVSSLLSLVQSEDTQAAGSGGNPGAGPMVTAWPSLGEGSSPLLPLPRLCLPRSPSQHPPHPTPHPHPPTPIAAQCEPAEAEYELEPGTSGHSILY